MERNTRTTLEVLRMGDRFYRPGDAKRIVYQKHTPVNRTHTKALKPPNYLPITGIELKNTTEVIFLRHTN